MNRDLAAWCLSLFGAVIVLGLSGHGGIAMIVIAAMYFGLRYANE